MSLKLITLQESWVISSKFPDSLTKHLFRYLAIREGVVGEVYRDSKGLDTVGVGHRVYANDKMPVGSTVSKEWILNTFKADMRKERVYEVAGTVEKFGLAAQIALASFVWTHGPGEFINSYTHKLIMAGSAEDVTQNWVLKNWDKTSPVNQARNKMDIMLIYPRVAEGVTYHASYGSSGTFIYVPRINESFTSLGMALDVAKKAKALSPQVSGVLQAGKIGG